MELVLVRLVDMSFNTVFSDLHCRYIIGSTGAADFSQIGGHEFQHSVLRSSL